METLVLIVAVILVLFVLFALVSVLAACMLSSEISQAEEKWWVGGNRQRGVLGFGVEAVESNERPVHLENDAILACGAGQGDNNAVQGV